MKKKIIKIIKQKKKIKTQVKNKKKIGHFEPIKKTKIFIHYNKYIVKSFMFGKQ